MLLNKVTIYLLFFAFNLFANECETKIENLFLKRVSEAVMFTDKSWQHIEGIFSGSKIKSGLHTFEGLNQLAKNNPGSTIVSLNPKSFIEYERAVAKIADPNIHKNSIYVYEFKEINSIAAFIPSQMMNAKAKSATYISAVSGRGHYLAKSLWPKNYTRMDVENEVRQALKEIATKSVRRDQILFKTKSGVTVEIKMDTFEVITAYREIDQIWLSEILMNNRFNLRLDIDEVLQDIRNSGVENIEAADWFFVEKFADDFKKMTHNYDEVLTAVVDYAQNSADLDSLDLIEKSLTNYIMKQDLQAQDILSLFHYDFDHGGIAVWDIFDEEIKIFADEAL